MYQDEFSIVRQIFLYFDQSSEKVLSTEDALAHFGIEQTGDLKTDKEYRYNGEIIEQEPERMAILHFGLRIN
ncbi:MAG TPA: hypothetical protein ENF16_04890 [Bacteroidetes bacterium]|nr:hypothetical protein [Bacteroidota bacterium]